MISTRRHLEYARGFLELSMFAEAAAELAAITAADRDAPEVLGVRADYHMQAKEWAELVAVARRCAQATPAGDKGWIYWAYALRELGRIAEAQAVLHEAEPQHGATCAVLHYNLSCYACLLGDHREARRRLALAFQMEAGWKDAALDDADLQAMRDTIKAMK